MRYFLFIASTVLVCLGTTIPALAAGRSIVLLQIPPEAGGWPAAERRAAAELASLGFEVSRVTPREIPVTSDRASTWGAQEDTIAVVRITQSGSAGAAITVVDVLDRITGKTTTRRVRTTEEGSSPDANIAALMAVELLYASLLEIEAPHPTRGEVPATAEVRSLVRQQLLTPASPARIAAHIGMAMSRPAGGVSPEPGLALGAAYFPVAWLAVSTDWRLNAVPATVGSGAQTAQVGWITGRLQTTVFAWPARTVSLFVGAGLGWLTAWTRGDSDGGIATRTDAAGTSFLTVGAGVAVRLRSHLRVRLALEPTLLASPIQVRFGGVDVARIGPTMLDGSVALEWLWP